MFNGGIVENLFSPLIFTAIGIAFIHTVLGPDHYLPFVALSKANNWSYRKTMLISFICGIAHCGSSVLIGMLGIILGIYVGKLEIIEGVRGDIASYLLIGFGLVYLIWAVKKLIKGENHSHFHSHDNGMHEHVHSHDGGHVHQHKDTGKNLFWAIFLVFIFGPCEPLIPILMYPASKHNYASVIAVALVFTFVTVVTMLTVVTFALKGLSFVRIGKLEKYAHVMASLVILISGLLIVAGL